MPDLADNYLLAGFVRVWEEVASLRQAQAEGRLGTHLGGDAEMSGKEMARLIAARLAAMLEEETRKVAQFGSGEQRRRQRIALYATCALIDEVLLLEFVWPGREAWLDLLLEYRFFRTRVAGQRCFALLEQFLLGDADADLAAIFLLVLKLGFKGRHRGPQGEARLTVLRQSLLARVRVGHDADDRLFPQAYQFQVAGKEARLAPLRPWLRAGGLALIAYLLLSSAVWLAQVQPFLGRYMGAG
jgi:type VI secretion system protein ImpK